MLLITSILIFVQTALAFTFNILLPSFTIYCLCLLLTDLLPRNHTLSQVSTKTTVHNILYTIFYYKYSHDENCIFITSVL
jgi:hypothetical protein